MKKENNFQIVRQKDIDELLCLYPQEERVIKNCKYSNGILTAELITKDISYSIATPDYFTAEQFILAISQMAYIMGGMLIKDEKFSNIDICFYETFLSKIKALECHFTRYSISFRKKVLKINNNLIEMSITKTKFFPTQKRLFIELIINVGDSFIAETQLITT